MSVVSHSLVEVTPYGINGVSNNNIYEYLLSDSSTIERNYVCAIATDVDVIAANAIPEIESGLITGEQIASYRVGEAEGDPNTIVPVFQSYAEFDLAVLTMFMKTGDVHIFHASLTLFKAMETRGGANAIQRAIYLGIDNITYGQIADRYGDSEGAAFFITNVKDQVWE